ncbi:monoamine oxidase [Sphingomonas vulcanisoli]|uniref:Tryptophan 2-monooxygenase n=1 Tax=Sphingomonas vulcanisoli TaxID=1658060 RepID=A0ABX0TT51_9SPHN|nr:flavin monoamine oxidase family protein [Sphingomonas vulcanisoli]NIJ06791.1 monoamine oxidase [Sphingomonas vulcanisoli]
MTRRSFLEGLGQIGGTSLLLAGMEAFGMGIASAQTAPPPLQGGGKGKKVIILGAGVAGLTSAYELGRAGYDVTVIEARSFAGGRSQTARKGFQLTELGGETQTCQFDDGYYINHGPWRIPFHHRSTLHYVKQFGIEVELFNNDNDNSYIYTTQGKGPLARKPLRKMEVAADARGNAAEILAKVTQSGALDKQFGADDKALFLEYLKTEGYLEGKDYAYRGTEGRGWISKPGAGLHPGVPSKPYAFTDVLDSGAWRVLASVSEWDQQRTMFQPKGGMYMIPTGFVTKGGVGDKIRFSTVVEKIRQNGRTVDVSVVDGTGQRSVVSGDYCICTIPLSVLKSIDNGLSAPKQTAMNGAAYAPVGKIGLQMKRRFWEENHWIYGGHIYTDDMDIVSVSLPSTGWLGPKGVLLGYYQFFANAAKVSALTHAQRTDFALSFGEKVFPEYRDSFETSFSVAWHRVKYNLGGWAMWSDESRARDYPVLLEPDDRIYLAGEHLSYIGGWQAGGIESAWMQIAALHKRASVA